MRRALGLCLFVLIVGATLLSAQGPPARIDTLAISPASLEFSRIGPLASDAQGHLYIADWGTYSVRELTETLSPVRSIGRKGAGPGEFASVGSVSILPNDSVLAYDPQLSRLTVFGPGSANPVRTVGLAAEGAGLPVQVLAGLGPQWLAIYAAPFVAGRPSLTDSHRENSVHILSPSGTISKNAMDVLPGVPVVVLRNGESVSAGSRPFGGGGSVHLAGSVVYLVDRDSASIVIRDVTRQLRQTFRLRLPPERLPIDPKDRRDTLALYKGAFQRAVEAALPRYWPPIAGVATSYDDAIWVGMRETRPDYLSWMRVDPSGRVTTILRLPRHIDLRIVAPDHLVGAIHDEDDVPRLISFRVR